MGSSASTIPDPLRDSNLPNEHRAPLTNNFSIGAHSDLKSASMVSGENQHSKPTLSPNRIVSADGYKWRKYGQKSVKGSNFPRSYYKCTFPGCSVKKFVEQCEEDGKIVEKVFYKGENKHTHDSIVITRLNAADQQTFKKSVIHESQTLDNVTSANPRLVIETAVNVDHLDDGYNWRKYGQKNVKGNPFPRSYYRCTDESCTVKKQVEKRGNTIINTYEGTHNHNAPGLNANKKKKRKLTKSVDENFGQPEPKKGETTGTQQNILPALLPIISTKSTQNIPTFQQYSQISNLQVSSTNGKQTEMNVSGNMGTKSFSALSDSESIEENQDQ